MVDGKQHGLKTLQSVPSPASGRENNSAAYFLEHHQSTQPQPNQGSLKMKLAPILTALLAACGIVPQTANVQDFSALRV